MKKSLAVGVLAALFLSGCVVPSFWSVKDHYDNFTGRLAYSMKVTSDSSEDGAWLIFYCDKGQPGWPARRGSVHILSYAKDVLAVPGSKVDVYFKWSNSNVKRYKFTVDNDYTTIGMDKAFGLMQTEFFDNFKKSEGFWVRLQNPSGPDRTFSFKTSGHEEKTAGFTDLCINS